jgi:hypothetical protein
MARWRLEREIGGVNEPVEWILQWLGMPKWKSWRTDKFMEVVQSEAADTGGRAAVRRVATPIERSERYKMASYQRQP